jgi:hypothetical protein
VLAQDERRAGAAPLLAPSLRCAAIVRRTSHNCGEAKRNGHGSTPSPPRGASAGNLTYPLCAP